MSSTDLSYTISPSTVGRNSTDNFTVTGTNKGGSAVSFNGSGVPILVDVNSLTDSPDGISPSTPTAGWVASALTGQPGYFLLKPTGASAEVAAGASVELMLTNVPVDISGDSGEAVVYETPASGGSNQAHLTVTIGQATPTISASAQPETVAEGHGSKINYTATNATSITLEPGGQSHTGTGGTDRGVFEVYPSASGSSATTTYTITAIGKNSEKADQQVPVTIGSVAVTSFSAKPQTNIGLDQDVTFSWTTEYAQMTTLFPMQGTQIVPANGSHTLKPGKQLADNDSTLIMTLQSTGYGGPQRKTVDLTFAPADILYFGLPDGALIPHTSYVNGKQKLASSTLPSGDTLWTMTLTGPGGPLIRYIGPNEVLQTIYFLPYNGSVKPGGQITLNWKTQYATSAFLNGEQVDLDVDDTSKIGTGSKQVTLSQSANFTLEIKDEQGNTQSNQILVTVKS